MAQNTYAAPQRPYPQPLTYPSPSYTSANSAATNQLQSQKSRHKSRSFSLRSDRSASKGHHHHSHLHETSEEKEAKRLHSKADPTLAMNEAEPSAVAAGVKSSMAPLRSIQHKDAFGNPIADPDKSNPTRSRWERPLDTIRSFEAAIDGAYNSRRSYVRADSESTMMRPRSYYPPRFPQDSYYNNGRPGSYRPDAHHDGAKQRDYDQSQAQGVQYHPTTYHPHNRHRASRTQTEPGPSNQRPTELNVYPLPSDHQSYETVASGGSGILGSGSSGAEASGYTTDPTSGSENSSIDRNGSPAKAPELINDYGISFSQNYQIPTQTLKIRGSNGQGSGPTYNLQAGTNYAVQHPQQPYDAAGLPKDDPIARKPMQISTPVVPQPKPSLPEKRKSWLMRRFSKNS